MFIKFMSITEQSFSSSFRFVIQTNFLFVFLLLFFLPVFSFIHRVHAVWFGLNDLPIFELSIRFSMLLVMILMLSQNSVCVWMVFISFGIWHHTFDCDFYMIPRSFKDPIHRHIAVIIFFFLSAIFFCCAIHSYSASLFRWELTCVTCWFIGFEL